MVTGGTRGIGLAAGRALAESGSDVILVGRDKRALEAAAEGLRATLHESGQKVHAAPVDLADVTAIAGWYEGVCSKYGVPDVLVNSAGINKRGLALDQTLEDWNAVMTVNATAMFELSRTFARRLIAEERSGRVVNIASLMTAAARPGTSPYTASKGAVGQLTKVLAVEWAKSNILVNAIAPGYIDTDLNKTLIADEAFDAWVKGRCPLGRWGKAEDVAWPVVFLASAAAGFMTGQVIFVDGVWLATF
jgi:gluconate 5-dehydrogenase